MSKALEEVLNYANEDVASIRKHWVIFVRMAKRIILFGIGDFLVYWKLSHYIEAVMDFINELIPKIPFQLSKYVLIYCILAFVIYAGKDFICTLIVYKTVGLSINNIQIKGVSGLASIGQINSSLEQIGSVRSHQSLFGRLFHYGNIEINLQGSYFTMFDMTDVTKFQESIILLQEAMKESRNMRSDERHDDSLKNQTMAQVQAMGMLSQTISQALPGSAGQPQAITGTTSQAQAIPGAANQAQAIPEGAN